MSTPSSESNPSSSAKNAKNANLPGPLSCFSGALMAGSLSLVCYRLTGAIAHNFADKPLPSKATAVNIAVAVRTLVVGVPALGMGIFGIAALGLAALGIQVLLQGRKSSSNESLQ